MQSSSETQENTLFTVWIEQLIQGTNPFRQINPEQEVGGYSLAYHLYQNKHYEDALSYFRLLVQAKPEVAKYWKGLASTLQMLKRYDEALSCYAAAKQLNESKPDPYLHIHSADCYYALNRLNDALLLLECAEKIARKTGDKRVQSHVTLMRQIWSVPNKAIK